jgi:DNA polymerase III subunit delta
LVDKIINEWKKEVFQPINWFEGDEPYHIDKLIDFAESNIIAEDQKDLNLSVFYGKDTDWPTVINACRRYPMFGDRQVVIIKEAQQMKDIEKLEPYFVQPLNSTILIVAYKNAKVDKRKAFGRMVSKIGNYIESKKMYDSDLPKWTEALVNQKGFKIAQKAVMLIVEHIGNDLNRIENEIEKLTLNITGKKEIEIDDIEKYIGISKEYNVFELQNALGAKNFSKAISIINYFEGNPKAAPLALLLPTLYAFYSKLYQMIGVNFYNENDLMKQIPGLNYYSAKETASAFKNYNAAGIESALLLLQQYNLKMLGINRGEATDGEIMKELVYKLIFS